MAQRETIDAAIGAWTTGMTATAAAAALREVAIPAAALARSRDLVESSHLKARGFWDTYDGGVLPGLPWHASFGKKAGRAPGLGADTDHVLRDVLQLAPDEIAALRRSGALG
jgi:formyl-CoA transferase